MMIMSIFALAISAIFFVLSFMKLIQDILREMQENLAYALCFISKMLSRIEESYNNGLHDLQCQPTNQT